MGEIAAWGVGVLRREGRKRGKAASKRCRLRSAQRASQSRGKTRRSAVQEAAAERNARKASERTHRIGTQSAYTRQVRRSLIAVVETDRFLRDASQTDAGSETNELGCVYFSESRIRRFDFRDRGVRKLRWALPGQRQARRRRTECDSQTRSNPDCRGIRVDLGGNE